MDRSAEEAAKMAEKLQGNGRVSKYANPITCLAKLDGKETYNYVSDHDSFTVNLPNGCQVVTYNLCAPGSPGGVEWGGAPMLDENKDVINERTANGLLADRLKQQYQDIQDYADANPDAIFCLQEFKLEAQQGSNIPTDFLKGSLANWSACKMVIKEARRDDYAFGNVVLFNPEKWGYESCWEMKGNVRSSAEGLRHQTICLKHLETGEDWTVLNGHNKCEFMKRNKAVSFYKDFLNSPGNRFIAGDLYLDHYEQAYDLRDLCDEKIQYASVNGARGGIHTQFKTSDYIFVKKGAQGQESSDLHKDFSTRIGKLINAPRKVALPSQPSQQTTLDENLKGLRLESKIQVKGNFNRSDLQDYPMMLAKDLLIPLQSKLNQEKMKELFGKLKEPLKLGDDERKLFMVFLKRLRAFPQHEIFEKSEFAKQWRDEIEKHVHIQWVDRNR